MPKSPRLRSTLVRAALLAGLAAASSLGNATHAWNNYHWARTTTSFTLKLGSNLTSGAWQNALSVASSDWTVSSVLDTVIVAGGTRPRNCRPTAGRGEVCNANYGSNGWLGIAQISVSGDHITQGIVKLNDTYFNTATYNTPAWRALVTCQEVGHIFGLGHQDEAFDNPNLNTCMDYTSNPDSNQHPNQHDYQMLQQIYSHLDGTSTVDASTPLPAAMLGRDFDRASSWGQMMKRSKDGARETYVREFGGGYRLVTHVFWAQQEGGPAHRQQRANEE